MTVEGVRGRLLPMDPRIGRRRAAVTRAQGRRRLRVLLVVLGLVAAGSGGLVALHSPLFSARHVQVVGAVHVPDAEVLLVAGLEHHPPLVDVDAAGAADRLRALAWVRTASVELRWPDSVRVVVTERRAAAAVAGSGSRAGRWALLDGTGRVLAWKATAPPGLPRLVSPAVAGTAGRFLGPAAGPGLDVVRSLPGQLPVAVGSITVARDGSVTLELADGVRADLGQAELLGPKLAALRSVLLGAPPSGPEVVDVRVPGEPTVAPTASGGGAASQPSSASAPAA